MLALIREKSTDDGIAGSIYLNGAFVCYSLENIHKAIPCGKYTLENSISPHFKRELPLVYNKEVKASRGIRIHTGNSPEDSAGCILVGMNRVGDEYINESSAAEKMLTMICRNNTELVISEV